MAYQSKYTGLQIDDILDSVEWKEGKIEDLEQIRAGAQKGATALQSYTEKYTGTVTGIKINGETKSGSGVIDLGTISTDISGKVDKVAGKQLSTEDFTTALKTKLEGLSNYDDTGLSEALSTLRGDFDSIVSGDTTTAIKTFNEVIAFLDGLTDTQDLESIIASIEQQIAGKMDTLISGTNIKTINGASILGSGDITISGGSSDANVQAVTYNYDDWLNEPTRRSARDAVDLTTGEKIYFTGHADYIQCGGSTLMDYIDDKAAAARIIKCDVEAGSVDYIPEEVLNWVFTQEGVLILNGGIAVAVYNEDWSQLSIQSAVVKDNNIVVTKVFLTALGYDSDLVTIDSYPIGGGSGGSSDTSDCVKVVIGAIPHMPNADGEVDLSADFASDVKVDGAIYSPIRGQIDLGYINKQLSTSTASSMTLSPNIYYRNTSTSLSTLTITLGSGTPNNIINEYFVEFTTSSSGTTVSLPSTIKWANGETPTFESSTTYQISIVNDLGTIQKFK